MNQPISNARRALLQANFKELPLALFLIRVVLAVVAGVIAGVLGLQGWSGPVAFALSAAAAHAFAVAWLRLDEEEWAAELAPGEWIMPTLGSFLLVWSVFSQRM